MNRERKSLLIIIILQAVLFCAGMDAYSNSNIRATLVTHSAVDNCGEYTSFSDVDFFDDEQINQISDLFSGSDFIFQIRIPQNCILIPRFTSLIWQPPKNK